MGSEMCIRDSIHPVMANIMDVIDDDTSEYLQRLQKIKNKHIRDKHKVIFNKIKETMKSELQSLTSVRSAKPSNRNQPKTSNHNHNHQPHATFREPNATFREPNATFREPNATFGEPNATFGESHTIVGNHIPHRTFHNNNQFSSMHQESPISTPTNSPNHSPIHKTTHQYQSTFDDHDLYPDTSQIPTNNFALTGSMII